jgi:hypothetical protein
MLPTCRPFYTILGPIGGAQMTKKWQKSIKKNALQLFWSIWASPKETKLVHRGPQVGKMYGPMFKLRTKLLIKSLGPIY